MRRLSLLFTLMLAPAAHAAPTQSLAVAVSEDNGNVFRRFLIGPDGRLTLSTRFRLANPNEAFSDFVSFDPTGRNAYVACGQNGSEVVNQYRIQPDGSLSPLSVSSVTVGLGASRMEFSPDGNHAYVICENGIWQFRLAPDGQLVSLASPVATTGLPTQKHNLRRNITKPGEKSSTYEVESGDVLSPLSLIFTKDGRRAYVLNHESYYKGRELVIPDFAVHRGGTYVDISRTITELLVGKDGELSMPSAAPTSVYLGASFLLLGNGGRSIYVQSDRSKTIFVCNVGRSGAVSPPVKLGVTGNAQDFTPSGRFSYVALNDTIRPCAVEKSGVLTPLTSAVILPDANEDVERNLSVINGLRVDKTGHFLFVYYASTASNHSIAVYSIQANGRLEKRPQTVTPVGAQLGGIMALLPAPERKAPAPALGTKAKTAVTSSKSPEFAYLLNADDSSISQFAIAPTGEFVPLSPPKIKIEGDLILPGPIHSHIAADPSGRHLYIPDAEGETVLAFAVAQDGTLSLLPSTVHFAIHPYPSCPEEIVIDPSSHFAFVTTYMSSRVEEFVIGPDGALAAEPIRTLPYSVDGAGSLGLFVNVATNMLLVRHGNNEVDSYQIGQDGSLASRSHFQPNLSQPLTFDPSGKFAFYGDSGGAVWQFLVSREGMMTENIPRSVPADQAVEGVVVHPNGRFAYAANGGDFHGDGSVSQYQLAADGKLIPLSPASVMTGTSPNVLAIDVTGQFLYSFSTHWHAPDSLSHMTIPDKLNAFRINVDGTLSSVGAVKVGPQPIAIVIVQPQNSH